MYKITHDFEDGIRSIQLSNADASCEVELLPEYIGGIKRYSIKHRGTNLNLLSHKKDYKQSSTSSAMVFRVLPTTTTDGTTNIFNIEDHCMQLFNYALRQNDFEISTAQTTEKSAVLVLNYILEPRLKSSITKIQITVRYELYNGTAFSINTKLKNIGTVTFSVFHHQQFCFSFPDKLNDWLLEMQTATNVIFAPRMNVIKKEKEYEAYTSLRKIGGEVFDHFFKMNRDTCEPLLVIRHPQQGVELQLNPGKSYPSFHVKTADDRTTMAIALLSAPAYAEENNIQLTTVQPGEEINFSCRLLLKQYKARNY